MKGSACSTAESCRKKPAIRSDTAYSFQEFIGGAISRMQESIAENV
ncbi:MAG: hypothetical protein ACI4J2_01880 [Ruminococcus sp.]